MHRRGDHRPGEGQQRSEQMKPAVDRAGVIQLQQTPVGQLALATEVIPQVKKIEDADRANPKEIGPALAFELLPALGDVPGAVARRFDGRHEFRAFCRWKDKTSGPQYTATEISANSRQRVPCGLRMTIRPRFWGFHLLSRPLTNAENPDNLSDSTD